MDKVKKQNIAVLLRLDENNKVLIRNGLKLAGIFGKELCLLYNYRKKERKELEKLHRLLNENVEWAKKEKPEITTFPLLISERKSSLPDKLADDMETIVIVSAFSDFRKYSGSLSESPVPFLFVNEKSNCEPEFKHLTLPIDFRKENSDSTLWSSYFGRYNSSEILVIAANDKRKDEMARVKRNVALAKKLFQKFSIQHKIYKGTKSSFRNVFESLELALAGDCDLFVMLASSSVTPLDWIAGLPERKILERAGNLPVLMINPRRDNYILCE